MRTSRTPSWRPRPGLVPALTLAVVLLLPAPAPGQHGGGDPAPPPRAYTTEPVGATDAPAWREDLRVLVSELERLHPDPWHRTPEARFDSAVAALDAEIPSLAAHEIVVGFARLLALVGDGHTSLPLYMARGVDFHVLPYRLGVYEDGVWVEAADRRHAALVGGRVVAIGGVGIDEALARVTPLVSRDNDNWIAAVAPNLLDRIEVLHALGMAGGLDGVDLTVALDGRRRTERVVPFPEPPPTSFGLPFLPLHTDDWVDARDGAGAAIPLHQRRFDDLYFWEYVPEHDLLYVKWDQVQNRESGPTALETFREAMAFARERRPARTVVDIRNNTGGEGGLVPAVVREIVRTREVDEPGRLFLVIGRRTFSAGQMMTSAMERYTTAVLVGEPSSAVYNGYAGHDFAHLPGSGIGFMVSPDYYQMGAFPRDRRTQATPRLAAVPTFADYRANRDPALEAILAYEPGALEREVMSALARGDTAGAADVARAYDARPVNRYVPSTVPLNALGYRHLNEGRIDDAISVFQLNVRVHPDYANGWDSLGEAYVRAHRRDDAIAAFRRALSIDPELAPAREWLRRLGGGG